MKRTPTARSTRRAFGERAYALLLRLYPRQFRERYGQDMRHFYRERALSIAERHRSPWRRGFSLARVWLHVVPDLLVSALAERFARFHRDVEPAPSVLRVHSHRREDAMSVVQQDIRFALRSMLRRPAFTAVVLATLALGIGANAAIFTVVNAVLLRPLSFAHAERIVDFAHAYPYDNVSEPEFVDYRRGVTAFERLAAYGTFDVTAASSTGEPMRTTVTRVSRDFFDVLGVKPALGRVIAPDEFAHASKTRPVVISHRFWVQALGADPSVVGRTLRVDGVRLTIVGVMPADFAFPDAGTTLWSAWRMNPDSLNTRNNHYLRLIGRLAPHATLDLARAQVHTLDQRWMHDFPETYFPTKPIVGVLTPVREHLLGPTKPYLLALLGAVGFILLIACVNVANLLLVRGDGRRKELAIRAALGASHGRVARQMLTESLLYAVLGAVLGVGLAWLGVRALVALAPSDVPRLDQVGVDARVTSFLIVVTVATGSLFGVAPALHGIRGDSAETLREGGRASGEVATGLARRALVVAEVALAVVMLAGAGLLVRSLLKLRAIDLGFDPRHVMTMSVTMPTGKYTDTTAEEFVRDVVSRVGRLPGVRSAAAVGALPISGGDDEWSIMLDGRVVKTIAEAAGAKPNQVTPDYFRAMSTRLLRGRAFTDRDRMEAPPVAVISEGMAKTLWPGVDPIGHTLRMFKDPSPWVTIVGVVADVRSRGYQKDVPPTMYVPYAQSASSAYYMPRTMTVVARSEGDPALLASGMRAAIRAVDDQTAIANVATMEDVVGDSIASRRFATALLAGFAALALVLAAIGIYGVIAYGVAQRTFEIGVRIALGASSAAVLRLVVSDAARMTLAGLALGLAGASLVDRLLRTMLVGVTPNDAPTMLVVGILLATVALCAGLFPARRATAISPTEALRNG